MHSKKPIFLKKMAFAKRPSNTKQQITKRGCTAIKKKEQILLKQPRQ
jgi:hypothetical protein